MPAAYLTHEAWLGDFRFYVDERVIIPRSFIAELLPGGLEPFVGTAERVNSALDMCTGSGCLAILLAHAYPDADIDAVDISSDALAVAQRNVTDYGLADRINLIRSDLFANLPEKNYDLVISNPPYVTANGDGHAAARVPARAAARARGRRRRPRRRARAREGRAAASSTTAARWSSRSATTAPRARRRFRACRSSGSPPAAADDGVFLVKREDIVAGR